MLVARAAMVTITNARANFTIGQIRFPDVVFLSFQASFT